MSNIAQILSSHLSSAPSAPTLRRDLAVLEEGKFVNQLGERKSTRYLLNLSNQLFAPIDSHKYCQIDINERPANQTFNRALFAIRERTLFLPSELDKLNEAMRLFHSQGSDSSAAIQRRELERFVIEPSWKSSKIESNTYTLFDAEILIKEGIEASGKTREEATMILNHKRAFDYILQTRDKFTRLNLSLIRDIDRLLVENLQIPSGLRNRLIGITGSLYKPLQVPTQIEEACHVLLDAIASFVDPFSRDLLALAGIGYIQPFEDGNKRTSRLTANAILLASQCAPLSYRSVKELSYREAMLTFYERNTILPLREIFIQQYMFAAEDYLKFA